ncbi:hypothetical protein G6F62_010312 [Rhizopus arrhizus]|nr:hypothetical protein G6F62_010312 [Rhizopus arrhizus]
MYSKKFSGFEISSHNCQAVPAGTYVSTSTLFKDGTNCDALYIPVSSNLSGLPPIILEFQRTVNMEFLRKSARYCLNTYDREVF